MTEWDVKEDSHSSITQKARPYTHTHLHAYIHKHRLRIATTNTAASVVSHYRAISFSYLNRCGSFKHKHFRQKHTDRHNECVGSGVFFVCVSLILAPNYCPQECCCVVPATTVHKSSSCRDTDG